MAIRIAKHSCPEVLDPATAPGLADVITVSATE
jgi:hypothetical protein